jgi:hypothetical protein
LDEGLPAAPAPGGLGRRKTDESFLFLFLKMKALSVFEKRNKKLSSR